MADREKDIVLRLIARLFSGRVTRYLDFACGTGRITQLLEEMADESYGVDVSPSMIEQAKHKCPRTEFFTTDATTTDLDIQPVQLVTAFRFFGNAQQELRNATLCAIHRLLAPSGYLIFNNHKNASSARNLLRKCLGDRPSEDLSYLNLRRLLARNGFKILRTYGVGIWLLRSRWKRDPILRSRTVAALEWMSKLPLAAPMCPDTVILAQKTGK